MPDRVPCPKCKRRLKQSGELALWGVAVPLYECPECIIQDTVFGEPCELPLIFAIDAQGRYVDPIDPENELKLD